MSTSTTTTDREAEQAALLAWFDRVRRDLPWRRTRDPYAIWLSEVMLQQTRVETVIPYYAKFLEDFPTVEALAAAPLEDVLARWAGLGYYRRARMLHAGAKAIAALGRFPATRDALLEVPGIGPYTAGAVASIAFEEPVPLVDGNVERVLSRLRGIREDVTKTAGKKALWKAAEALVPQRRAGDVNQALMELGATLCAPKSPRCEECPLVDRCVARAAGDAASLPVKGKGATVKEEHRIALVAVARGEDLGGAPGLVVLLGRRREDARFGGLYEPVQRVVPEPARDVATIEDFSEFPAAIAPEGGFFPLPALTHVLSHRRLVVTPYRGRLAAVPGVFAGPHPDYERLAVAPLAELGAGGPWALSTLARKILAAAGLVPLRKRPSAE